MSSTQMINKRNGEADKIMVDSVYIPQIDSRLTEYDVTIAFKNIADVKYVDFVANKYNNKLCSAFVYFYKTLDKEHLERDLHGNEWAQIELGRVLLENTSLPIPRTKTNIHQLAWYMDECYQKMAKQDMQIERLLQIVSEQSRLEEIRENKMKDMEKRIEELEKTDIPELIDPYSYSCDICGRDFLEKKELYWHSTVCKESEQIQHVDCEYCGNCFNTSEITEGRCPACFGDYMDWLQKYANSPNKQVEMHKYTQQYLNDYLDDPFEDWNYSSEQEEEQEEPPKNMNIKFPALDV